MFKLTSFTASKELFEPSSKTLFNLVILRIIFFIINCNNLLYTIKDKKIIFLCIKRNRI